MVGYEQRGRVAVLTIRRPEARNAVNGDVAQALEAAVDRFEGDDDTWAAVLAGEGPVFSAGADLKAVAAGRAAELLTERGGFGGFVAGARAKPVVAAVGGRALVGGGGLGRTCEPRTCVRTVRVRLVCG